MTVKQSVLSFIIGLPWCLVFATIAWLEEWPGWVDYVGGALVMAASILLVRIFTSAQTKEVHG